MRKKMCPKCKAAEKIRYGYGMTSRGKYQKYQCIKCGTVYKGEYIVRTQWHSAGKSIQG